MKNRISKKVLAVLTTADVMLLSVDCLSQGVAINTTGAAAHSSVILDVSSIN